MRRTKKRPGKLWFRFTLFGLPWEVRIAPEDKVKSFEGDACMAVCYFGDRWMLFSDKLSPEQFRTTLAHELQHAIEDHADVDYSVGVSVEIHDRWTDQVARGWLYLLRHNPEIIAFLRAEKGPLG